VTPTTTKQKQDSADRRARNREHGERRSYPRVRARPIYKGRSYKITRRCLEQRMFFVPDSRATELNNLIGYCLAHAAKQFKIQVHACVFMSNHHHTDVTDPHGNLIGFKQLFHSLVARGVNAMRGRNDAVWTRDRPCDTRRSNEEKSLRDLVYTLTNPVKDGLVKWGEDWPGFTTHGWRFGETRTFKRPADLFDKQGDMPETVELTLYRPPIYMDLDDDDFFKFLMDAVHTREKGFQDERRLQNLRFMGAQKVRQQNWKRAPQSFEERFKQAPRVAVASKWLRLAELQRDRDWERKYAEAREELLRGKDVVFPEGTYWLRRFAGVKVAGRAPP
jgi:hypothetical protein